MKSSFAFFLFCLIAKLSAQQPTAVQIFDDLNKKITSINHGYFDCAFTWKSLMKSDSTLNSGRTYFFKSHNIRDSIAQFWTEMPSNVRKGYDGETFYTINDETRSILKRLVAEKGGVSSLIRGNHLYDLAFQNYIFEHIRPPFLLNMFTSAEVDTLSGKSGEYILITRTYTSPNLLKITERDPETMQTKQEYEISLPDMTLRCKREWVNIGERFQFVEQRLSPIKALPDSIGFERLLNLDSLLQEGYSITDKTAPKPALISVGDTLPIFHMLDLDSNLIANTHQDRGIILLDFWYKNCAPCLFGMPAIERLYKKYKDRGLSVYGINGIDNNPDELKKLQIELGITYPTLLDSQKSLSKHLNITGYPTIILVDSMTRKIIFTQVGIGKEEEDLISKVIETSLK